MKRFFDWLVRHEKTWYENFVYNRSERYLTYYWKSKSKLLV